MRIPTPFDNMTTNCSIKYDTNSKWTFWMTITFPFPDLAALKWNRLWPTIKISNIQIWISKHIRQIITTTYAKVIRLYNKPKTSMGRDIFTHLGHNNAQINCFRRISYKKWGKRISKNKKRINQSTKHKHKSVNELQLNQVTGEATTTAPEPNPAVESVEWKTPPSFNLSIKSDKSLIRGKKWTITNNVQFIHIIHDTYTLYWIIK